MLNNEVVPAVDLPENLKHLVGVVVGSKAPCLSEVSVDTPMDPSQRDFNPNDVIKYISKSQGIDWNLFGYVTVVEDPTTGLRTMINGQHRTSIVKTLAPDVKTVPAHIIRTDDPQYAAKLFAYLNGVASRNVSREQLLWAEVLAGDPAAIKTKQQLIYCDLACGKVNAALGRKDISRAAFEKCAKLGVEETRYAAQLIGLAYPKQVNFDNLIHGLVYLLTRKEYTRLNDVQRVLGQRFAQWFTTVLPVAFNYKESTKLVTRTDPWQISIAYGLYTKFHYWMSREQLKNNDLPSKDAIGSLYKLAKEEEGQ